MVYFRMIPLGLVGGSQDTTTLLAEEGTALIPAGGPGTRGERKQHRRSPSRGDAAHSRGGWGGMCGFLRAILHTHWDCRPSKAG